MPTKQKLCYQPSYVLLLSPAALDTQWGLVDHSLVARNRPHLFGWDVPRGWGWQLSVMVTHRLIGQASTQMKNSADWSQRKVQWMGWLNTAVLQHCMQTTQEMMPGSTKRWRFEVKWLSSVSGGSPPGLTTCAFVSCSYKSLLGVWPKRHFVVRVPPLPCSDTLALQTRWCV